MKVVINKCFGGFGLSGVALTWLFEHDCEAVQKQAIAERFDNQPNGFHSSHEDRDERLERWRAYRADPTQQRSIFDEDFSPDEQFVLSWGRDNRTDPLLIQCVEELGDAANGECAELCVVEIPDGTEYEIAEHDGNEHIAERHQTWV